MTSKGFGFSAPGRNEPNPAAPHPADDLTHSTADVTRGQQVAPETRSAAIGSLAFAIFGEQMTGP